MWGLYLIDVSGQGKKMRTQWVSPAGSLTGQMGEQEPHTVLGRL